MAIPEFLRHSLFGSLIGLFLAFSATAQSNRWVPIHPGAGFSATAIAVDPQDSRIVYFGTDKGEMLRSRDGGTSWQSVHLEAGSFPVSSLAIAPSPASTVYAVFTHSAFEGANFVVWSRVLRSVDGGATWERATNGLRNIGVRAIAVDPFNSSRVYAAGTGGVFRSDDRGRTWSEANNGITDPNIGALVADPSVPGTLYAGVAYRYGALPGGVFRTMDGGLHWTDVGSLLAENGIIEVRALAAGNNPSTVYASIQRQTVLGYSEDLVVKSVDGGETWSRASDPLFSVTGLFVDPRRAATVYADASSGIYKTTNGGERWDIVPGVFSAPLAIDPNATDTVYAPSVGKTALIAKSENAGASWTDLALGLRSPRVAAVAIDPRIPTTVYLGTFEDGVFKSTDGGTTWTTSNTGLGDLRISLLTIIPWEMPVLFAATVSREIYRSTDGARTWTLASRGLPIPFSVVAIAGDPSSFGTLYVATGAGVFKTTDLGETWTEADTGPEAPLAVRSLAVDPEHAGVVYAATTAGVSKSTDGGATWQDASNGLGARIGTVIAVDPLDPSVLYLSTSRRELYHGGPATIEVFDIVFRSVDGGSSWVPLDEPRLTLVDESITYATFSITIDPSSGAVYMSAAVGLIRSRDRGSHWELLNEGLPSGALMLAIGRSSAPILYAAQHEGGLFRIAFEGTQRLCVSSPTALCLDDARFRVEVSFNARNVGMNGDGHAHPITDESGAFWFFSPQNLEVVVKVVDGRAFNERFWVFFAGLSDVEYSVTVTDTATGSLRTYFNPSGRIASQADADAFFPPASATPTSAETSDRPSDAAGACASAGSRLCLNDGRFRADVSFRTSDGRQSGVGMPVGLTSDTGYFWFFSAGNIELVMKVVDGRPVNGHFWVFYGGLTDVELAITVTDTVTGATRNYFKPAGALASDADTSAF
jgi:photosystem II stability/assembly factor-like uncharacterized protein